MKELLLKDLCARLPYKVIIDYAYNAFNIHNGHYVEHGTKHILICYLLDVFISPRQDEKGEYIKPYLFPLSSMTEEQAKELSILYGIKDILSIKITDEYIDFEVDDGFCSTEIKTIWYNEIISSIETFDWLNKNHFDYRGLIPMGLAIDATGLNVY